MARLFTRAEALAQGVSDDALKWALRSGKCVRLAQAFTSTAIAPKPFDRRLAKATTLDRRVSRGLAWCLRKGRTTINQIEAALKTHPKGNGRIRRVPVLRPVVAFSASLKTGRRVCLNVVS